MLYYFSIVYQNSNAFHFNFTTESENRIIFSAGYQIALLNMNSYGNKNHYACSL